MEEKQRTYEIRTGCDRGLCRAAVGRQDRQLNTYDWLADVPGNLETTDLVEVQFKHTRKGYYHNVNNLPLKKGDIVAVEASPGHDIGVVTLTGRLVTLQIKKANLKSADDIKRIYRLARQVDMDKYLVFPRALLLLGNPDYEWLADESMLVSAKAARKVWQRFGIDDRMGWSIVNGHGHCQLPESQYPEVQAFIDRFLLGRDADTHDIRIVNIKKKE